MALELRQQLKLTQQLIMTPQLQMAIKLLQLSRLELMDTVRRELEENPALEEVPESAGDEQLAETEAPAPPPTVTGARWTAVPAAPASAAQRTPSRGLLKNSAGVRRPLFGLSRLFG